MLSKGVLVLSSHKLIIFLSYFWRINKWKILQGIITKKLIIIIGFSLLTILYFINQS